MSATWRKKKPVLVIILSSPVCIMAVVKTSKRKKVSKKNKVSWRKHVNINDVDDFLEEKRLEERLGPIDTVTDEQLFKVDTKPQSEAELLSAKQRNKLRILIPPKCFAVLQPHTKVPDPITKRNHVRTKEERKCPIIKKREQERKLKGIHKAKELQQMKDKLLYEQQLKNKSEIGVFKQDIWNIDEDDNKFQGLGEWMEKSTKRHVLRGVGELRKITSKVVSEPASISSVELPHPGMSYNPGYEDHQNLLRKVVEKEMFLIKQENHLNRVTKNMFRKVNASEYESSWLVEMSEGLPKAGDKDNGNKNDGAEYDTPGHPVINKKKTAKQRRKQKEQLELEKLKQAAKIEKKKCADIHRLRFINKAIEKNEEKEQILKEQQVKKKILKAKQTKRLGKLKFEEPTPDFVFSKDIPGNLRKVKCEGNALADRFISLQKRNILETTVMQMHKKIKVKRYHKPGFKENWKTTVARSFQLNQ